MGHIACFAELAAAIPDGVCRRAGALIQMWLTGARRIYFRPDLSLKNRLFGAKRGPFRLQFGCEQDPLTS
jgi:hypothetical protein